jgi:hypothetical protein
MLSSHCNVAFAMDINMDTKAPNEKLTQRVYNMGAIDFTPKEIAAEIARHKPGFQVTSIGLSEH